LDTIPEIARLSSEVDFLMLGLSSEMRNRIETEYGVFSKFREEFGAHIDTLGLATVVLPPNWQKRLVPFRRPDGAIVAYCIEIYDLCVSKFFAGREKDITFLTGLLLSEQVDITKLVERLTILTDSPQANALADRIDRLLAGLSRSNAEPGILVSLRDLKSSLE
jgi:hypothetical protein